MNTIIQGILNLYKERGETPLERIERFKKDNPAYEDIKMTYAGRLDPAAEGVLLVLAGDYVKKKEEYLGLMKEYYFEVIFGLKTDTYDLLGIIDDDSFKISDRPQESEQKIKEALKSFIGKKKQEYPMYSSKTYMGKPLFKLAKEGVRELLDHPKKEIEIYSLEFLERKNISKLEFEKNVYDLVSKVKGDFRQKEITGRWVEYFSQSKRNNFEIYSFRVSCSSGTYVRSIANELGKIIGSGALTFKIIREKVGDFSIKEPSCGLF